MQSVARKVLPLLSMMLCVACTSGPKTDPSNYPKTYQARYVISRGKMAQLQRRYSDGVGMVRVDTGPDRGPRQVSVFDLSKGEVTFWTDGSQQFVRRPLKANEAPVVDLKAMEDKNTKVGSRDIEGHDCIGYRNKDPKVQSETWIDNDFKIIVLATSGDVTIKLDKFATDSPDPVLFKVPDGYTEIHPK